MVDFVFSGSRLKLWLEWQNVLIALCIQGIRIPTPDKNSDLLTDISNAAKEYTKSIAHQRDCKVEIWSMDKKGNFFGQVWINENLLALNLL